MTEQYHQHARELAKAVGLRRIPLVTSYTGAYVGNWYKKPGEDTPIEGWSPHTNRDHLAVCLRECDKRDCMKEVAVKSMNAAGMCSPGKSAWTSRQLGRLLYLFANDPATIAEACHAVLVGRPANA